MIQPTLDEQTLDIIIKAKPKDKEILARTIFGEASNQGEEGMTAVGNVILNRYRSNLPKYKTKDFEGIKSVILKPYAFTVYNDKKDENYNRMMSATKENESYAKALDIAEKLLTGKIKDNTGGATHYFNPDEAENFYYFGTYDVDFNKRTELDVKDMTAAEANKKIAEQTSDKKELPEQKKVVSTSTPPSNPFYANPNLKVIDEEFSHKSLYGEILNMDVPVYRYQSIDNKLTKVIELLTEIAESERRRDSDNRD